MRQLNEVEADRAIALTCAVSVVIGTAASKALLQSPVHMSDADLWTPPHATLLVALFVASMSAMAAGAVIIMPALSTGYLPSGLYRVAPVSEGDPISGLCS